MASEDEKEVNEGILMLGNKLQDSIVPVACNLFTNSDQESTDGEDEVLGNFSYLFEVNFALILSILLRRGRH